VLSSLNQVTGAMNGLLEPAGRSVTLAEGGATNEPSTQVMEQRWKKMSASWPK